MSAEAIYDFEGIIETAAKQVMTALEVKSFTTRDVPDFQRDRPRTEIKCTLGAGLQRWVPIVNGAVVTPQTQNVTPSLLQFCRRESAWAFDLKFAVLTAASIDIHTNYRAEVRAAVAQLWQLINGSAPMTRHCVQMTKDGGSSPVLIAPEQNLMQTEISFSGSISVQADAWGALEPVPARELIALPFSIAGDPPAIVPGLVGQWRLGTHGEQQSYNPDTALWHTVGVTGSPATITYDPIGEA